MEVFWASREAAVVNRETDILYIYMIIFFLPTTRNLFCRIIFEQESTSLELFYNVQLNILNIYLPVEFSSVFLSI